MTIPSITIYSENTSPRLRYILDLIIGDMLGLEYSICTDSREICHVDTPVINYSGKTIPGALHILPNPLLFEDKITLQNMPVAGQWDGTPVFFESRAGDIPFDLFAASFYLVTRYEEYLPFNADKHNRFPAKESYSYRQDFHHLPVINIWVQKLSYVLKSRFPDLITRPPSFQYLSTIDIDRAWAFLNKPFIRSALSVFKSLYHLDYNSLRYKLDVLSGKQADPDYTFPAWADLHKGMDGNVILFFLVSNASEYDMLNTTGNKQWQQLVISLSRKYPCGVHPSYNSDLSEEILKEEIKFLESIIYKPITKSRQHFIKLRFPYTYRALCHAGIKEDYSMGFHDAIGFRAGIAYPFRFFDLKDERETELLVFPFALMDRTLKDYMGLSNVMAMKEIEEIISLVRNVGGLFISVWHNNSLANKGEWESWLNIYKKMNDLCKKAGS